MLRKIKSQEEIARRRRKNQVIIGLVLTLLMVLSTAGYSLISRDSDKSTEVEENGFVFFYENGVWISEIDGGIFRFQYLPSQVSNISVSGFYSLGDYSGQTVYFVGNAEGSSEILNNIGGYFLRYQGACLNNSNVSETCERDLPTKDCDSNLIIFEEGNKTSVYKEDNCVYLVGDSVKSADAFLYKILMVN